MSTLFRDPEPALSFPGPEPEKNVFGATENLGLQEPVEPGRTDETVLLSLGVDDAIHNLPDEDKSNLSEITSYVEDQLKSKGIAPTVGAFQRAVDSLKERLEMDPDTDPSVVLDKIGGVIKAWKSLSFISDPREKRSLFMKLARQPDSKAMDRVIYEEMEKRRVWQ